MLVEDCAATMRFLSSNAQDFIEDSTLAGMST